VSYSCTLARVARLPAQIWQCLIWYGSTHHIGMWRPLRGAHTAFFLLACSVVHNACVPADRSCDEQPVHGCREDGVSCGRCIACGSAVDSRHSASCVRLALGLCFMSVWCEAGTGFLVV
jgi:hypothetical protein